jgi:hypothetical protein
MLIFTKGLSILGNGLTTIVPSETFEISGVNDFDTHSIYAVSDIDKLKTELQQTSRIM